MKFYEKLIARGYWEAAGGDGAAGGGSIATGGEGAPGEGATGGEGAGEGGAVAAGGEGSGAEGAGAGGEGATNSGEGAPESYELKLGEGMDAQAFESFAREHNMTNEQAQAVADYQAQQVQAQTETWNQTVDSWEQAVKADPEMGGEKYDETVTNARAVVNRFGNDALKQALNHGWGNHPELVRFLSKVGAAMAEDRFTGAGGSGNAGGASLADKLYPSN